MKVMVVTGYGQEKETKAQQKKFLNYFKELLNAYGLQINCIVSERATGGPITITTPDDTDPDFITRVFLSLATDLAKNDNENEYCTFDLVFPFCPEPISVTGSAY